MQKLKLNIYSSLQPKTRIVSHVHVRGLPTLDTGVVHTHEEPRNYTLGKNGLEIREKGRIV